MKRKLVATGIFLIIATTAWYSVVNVAQSAVPDRTENAAACSFVAPFCGDNGGNICNSILPRECGAMQKSGAHAGDFSAFHAIFFLAWVTVLLGCALVALAWPRRHGSFRQEKRILAWRLAPLAKAPPILIGNLAALRF